MGTKATGLDVLVGPTVALSAYIQSTSRTSAFWEEDPSCGRFISSSQGGYIMPKYIALHTLKKSADEVMKAINDVAPEFARTMAAGKTPARCIKTWNPLPHGRTDYVFCLWEADKPEDIVSALGPILDFLTVDNIKVDEIDWQELAKTL
jgi:hypothetical protein